MKKQQCCKIIKIADQEKNQKQDGGNFAANNSICQEKGFFI